MADTTEIVPTAKPGYKTTEFWLSLVAVLLTSLFASGLIKDGSSADKIAGFIAASLTALGYSVSRAMVKKAA